MQTDDYYRDPDFDEDLETDDPRPRRRWGMVAAIALLLVFGIGIWYAYSRGVQRGVTLAPPLIKAEQGPTKVAPDDPGGLQVPNQDKAIYDRLATQSRPEEPERLLPPPEQPKPEVLPDPPAPEAQPQTAVTVAPVEAPPATATAPAPSSASAPPVAPPPPAEAKVAAVPAETRAPQPAAQPPARTEPPRAAPSEQPRVVAAAPPAAGAKAAAGGLRIQLGAYKDAGGAEEGWRQLTRQHPELLGGLRSNIVRADLGDRGVFQRLQAGPLSDRGTAQSLCDKLKARGQGCIVVSP